MSMCHPFLGKVKEISFFEKPEITVILKSGYHLKNLVIRQFAFLYIDSIEDLHPYLRKMQIVIFPQNIFLLDVILYQTVKIELFNRMPPNKIIFEDFNDFDEPFNLSDLLWQ